MLSTIMVSLDSTICNVALPQMQSAMMATQEQIVWVLTSYIIASAVMTPLSGWLAQRYGRKRVMMASVTGFTLTSLACGLSTNLEELVLFRTLQGLSGAGLSPLSQATMLDMNPPERHGAAMAIFGIGAILGPIVGPTLGGFLTDKLSWHWIFFVNLPVGVLAALLLVFVEEHATSDSRFDLTGFGFLALAVAMLQLTLDRGQQLDWFASTEIWIEATLAVLFGYLTVVHMSLISDPFIKPALLRDRNFLIGSAISVVHGMLVTSVMVMLAPLLQTLMRYTAMQTGLVTMPRGFGTMAAMLLVGRLVARFDPRLLLGAGLLGSSIALLSMAHFTLDMGPETILVVGLIQGFWAGFIFVPLSTVLFSTLDPALRNEAASLFALSRYLGAAVGISILQTLTVWNTATVHARLAEGVRPDSAILAWRDPAADFAMPEWVAGMDRAIAQQASMVAYVDAFWLLSMTALATLPLVLLLRAPLRQRQ